MAGVDEKSIEAQPGGSRADAIKRFYGSEIAKLYTAAFDLTFRSAEEAVNVVERTLSGNVGRDAKESVFMAEGEALARGYRDEIKAKVLELELERAHALTHLAEEIESEIAPVGATPTDIITASSLSEERLIQAADACAAMPEAQSDLTLKVLLASARAQGYDQAMWHVAAL